MLVTTEGTTLVVDLSPREYDILTRFARGLVDIEIAHQIGHSRSMVRTHLDRLHAKFGLHSSVAVCVTAWENGIIPWETVAIPPNVRRPDDLAIHHLALFVQGLRREDILYGLRHPLFAIDGSTDQLEECLKTSNRVLQYRIADYCGWLPSPLPTLLEMQQDQQHRIREATQLASPTFLRLAG